MLRILFFLFVASYSPNLFVLNMFLNVPLNHSRISCEPFLIHSFDHQFFILLTLFVSASLILALLALWIFSSRSFYSCFFCSYSFLLVFLSHLRAALTPIRLSSSRSRSFYHQMHCSWMIHVAMGKKYPSPHPNRYQQ